MRSLILGFLVLFSIAPSRADRPSTTLIVDASVLDVVHRKVQTHQNILLINDQIAAVFPAFPKKKVVADRTLNGAGLYVTPGLIDMHIHMDLWHWEAQSDNWSLPLYIANGVTSVRDCAGSSLTLAARSDINAGKRIGPRMFIATPFFTKGTDPDTSGNERAYPTSEAAIEQAGKFLAQGYDFAKVDSTLTEPMANDLAAYFQSKKSFIFGHPLANQDVDGFWHIPLTDTLKSYHTTEHLPWAIGDYLQSEKSPYYHYFKTNYFGLVWYAIAYPDFTKVPSLIQLLKENHAILDPTILAYDQNGRMFADKDPFEAAGIDGFHSDAVTQYLPDYYYDDWKTMYDTWGATAEASAIEAVGLKNQKQILKQIDAAGIDWVVGTDTPARPHMVPGFALHDEIQEYVDAGIPNWNILRSATWQAARALQKENELGAVRAGAFADLIITNKNPIDDLSVLKKPNLVIARGHVYSRSDLDQILADVKTEVRTIHYTAPKASSILKKEKEEVAFGAAKLVR